eukprot:CAMPEP_0202972228 /NCGR_PEP_ID=MMETSP1396-20130829/34597_1 /ASSEMBLY_ACC=CAM_ASM_000872 /TAXON_ID= /ORGANISM="Pseudokeronopsis sp., Strain Brazil" /LENGTH=133 /DNA_ID=CAMNT_0049702413 /DNA_START=60 /DNA_END=461 /DNA_ORIENTATION=-
MMHRSIWSFFLLHIYFQQNLSLFLPLLIQIDSFILHFLLSPPLAISEHFDRIDESRDHEYGREEEDEEEDGDFPGHVVLDSRRAVVVWRSVGDVGEGEEVGFLAHGGAFELGFDGFQVESAVGNDGVLLHYGF